MGNPEREESESPNAEHEQFEFWMVGNPLPSFPQPQHLLTADQLFADGIILPLHSHSHSHSLDDDDDQHNSPLPPLPHSSIVPPPNYSIKKWKHINIFATRPKQNMKKPKNNSNNNSGSVSSCNSTTVTATATAAAAVAAAADQLNIIHIWPFSRSRSTGTRPATTSSSTKARFHNYVKARAGRKASSAPCSRSNSRGDQQQQEKEEFSNSHRDQPEEKEESSSVETTTTTEAATAPPPPPPTTTVKKKWGPLVGGMGVRVRRSMPVWQMRRGSRSGNSSSCENNESSKTLLNHLNVSSTCIGYESSNGSSSSCGSENKDGVTEGEANGDGTAATAGGGGGGGGGASGGLFSLKGIFSKKV